MIVRKVSIALAVTGLLMLESPTHAAEPSLRMVAIDLEGGGGTLFVTPEGQSLLIDAGWPTGTGVSGSARGDRNSADRIVAVARTLSVSKIDYLIITHYHRDHIGGVEDLLARMPVGVVIDHGPNRQGLPKAGKPEQIASAPATLYVKYLEAIKGHEHIIAKAGDVIQIGSLTDTIVASDGIVQSRPLNGAGAPNPACDDPAGLVAKRGGDENNENTRSVASLLRFGEVTIAAFGDLSWSKEHDLSCPIDKVGHVNLLIVTQHGSDISSNPANVAAMRPDVAIMANGEAKGGDPDPVRLISTSPGLQGFWRLHENFKHPELTGDKNYVANLSQANAEGSGLSNIPSTSLPDMGHTIHAEITRSGSISVTNDRNGFSKTYQVR